MPEEVTLDYTEINSIPPLPLWTLLAADKETTSQRAGGQGGTGGAGGEVPCLLKFLAIQMLLI